MLFLGMSIEVVKNSDVIRISETTVYTDIESATDEIRNELQDSIIIATATGGATGVFFTNGVYFLANMDPDIAIRGAMGSFVAAFALASICYKKYKEANRLKKVLKTLVEKTNKAD